MTLYVARREAARIQAQDFVVEALQTSLALGHQLWRKAPVAITRDHQVQWPGVRLHRLLALAVAGVLLLRPVAHMRGIPQVGGQLGFQHPLDHPFGQTFQ
jgi:hypothetical protein